MPQSVAVGDASSSATQEAVGRGAFGGAVRMP
jgi:hypothetical protein